MERGKIKCAVASHRIWAPNVNLILFDIDKMARSGERAAISGGSTDDV